jgi:hypothetical protein
MNDKKKIQQIIKSLSQGFNADERESSVLIDHHSNTVFIETTQPAAARRIFKLFYGKQGFEFSTRHDTLRVKLPAKFARNPEMIVKSTHR